MRDYLEMEWIKLPNGQTTGYFKDTTGNACSIAKAQFYSEPAITITSANGVLVLSQQQAAELCLVLGYFGYSGQIPEGR